jgi:hypothetical protein
MRKANHYIFLLIGYCLILLFSGCSKDDETEEIPVTIKLSSNSIRPDKLSRTISVNILVNDISRVRSIDLTKTDNNIVYEKSSISGSELNTDYEFIYKMKPSDPESILTFTFTLIDNNGNRLSSQNLSIDNRRGLVFDKVTRTARVTGRMMNSDAGIYNPNMTDIDYNVGGTDLGIIWEMDKGKYGIFFGDTFGNDFIPNPSAPGPNGGSWRSNVLAFSEDNDMEDGLTFSGMATDARGYAREIVYGAKNSSGNGDWTSIPTAAIRANGIDYVHYMNIRNWTGWVTNHSGLYYSVDNGQNWDKSDKITWSSNSNFGQAGYYKKDGYVYMVGTETGRFSNPRLARFKEKDIENKAAYEYWNGAEKNWIKGDEARADNLFQDTVGELSVIYSDKFDTWILTYFCEQRYNISVRIAKDISGPWSEPIELANGRDYPQLYGSYIHPVSADSDNLYFLMSMWMPYNVFLMKAEMEFL